MKKIMHVAEPFATGVLSFLVDLTRQQVEEYEVYILYGVRPLTPDNVSNLFDKRVHLIKIDSFKGAIGTVFNFKAYRDVRRWYIKIDPDIVHFHSSASGFVGRWALPCKKLSAFYTPHGYSFLMRNGTKFKRFLFWLIEYLSAKRSAVTIACSEGEYKEAMKLSKRSTYVNNGINTKNLKSFVRSISKIQHPIKICTSGRILYQKNPKLFNEIARLLPEAQFIWIGEGELESELTSPNICVTGWIKREEALNIIKDVDFFILPSLWEGLPISLLEAMYLKKICLVSDVIGNRDVIKNGINGLICHSANEYADLIRSIADGKVEGVLLAEHASNDIEEDYNIDLMAQKYDEIYFQIALNYGSRDEIIRGIRKLAQDAADGKVKPEEIDEHVFDNYLDTAGIPDPDLMIRTSGELRLSNFLLWQMAYTEFYFTDVAWPDFNKAELIKAIEKYNQRDRRYGGVKEE